MKILLVIPSITNYFTFLDELTLELKSGGHQVGLASSGKHFKNVNCYDSLPHCDFFPVELPRGMSAWHHFKARSALKKVIEQYKPDIVHANTGAGIFTTALASRFTKYEHRPLFMATHHGMVYPLIQGWRKWIIGISERWSIRQLDQLYLLNASDKKSLEHYGIVERVNLYQKSVGLGCRIDQFNPADYSNSSKIELRKKLGIQENDFVFIFVGRHVCFKGFDITIKAFFEISVQNSRAKLLLLGEPYEVHPTGLSKAEDDRIANDPNIISNGWVKEVDEYLSIADILVFPSEREGMPVNLMESLSMGVPAITRDTRGCNEIVDHERTGWLLSQRDIGELKSVMQKIMDDDAMRESMKANALNERNRFDRNIWVAEQIEIYDRMLNQRSVTSGD